jgi:hypothetical protein
MRRAADGYNIAMLADRSRQFGLRLPFYTMAIVALSCSVPSAVAGIVAFAAFVTFFALYLADRDRQAVWALFATASFFARYLAML